MASYLPPTTDPDRTGWRNHYRLVASQFPPIPLFEDYVDPELMEAAFQVESRTNSRLRAEAGELGLVPMQDYVLGEGSTPVMAAFTHIGRPSRFTDGSFGVYYAGNTLDTTIAEVKFHRTRFLEYTSEPPTCLMLRSYVGDILHPLLDIRDEKKYQKYLNANTNTYPRCQKFSSKLRETKAWGLLYPSVRYEYGECVAFYRPPAVGIPRQHKHIMFQWDGKAITDVFEANPRN